MWGIVLGVSSGTGAAIARSVSESPGLDIFGVHRGHYTNEAEQLVADISRRGRKAVLRVADAGTAEGASAGAAQLAELAGKKSVKLFVHSIANASLGPFASGSREWLTPRHFEKTFASMAHSFVYWTQELVARDLLAADARLLGLTNTLPDSLVPHSGLIAAAKGALEQYIRQLAVELGPLGHRVNLLKFSTVITPALERLFGPAAIKTTEKYHAMLNPAGRICTVEEVGDFVSWLLDPKAAWLNGATIDFTGGTMIKMAEVVLDAMKREGASR